MKSRDLTDTLYDQSILIVEDDPLSLEVMKEILEDYFQDIYTAGDGLEALEVFEKNSIDVILCDINMPRMDGLETIKNIRKSNYTVPIIIISALSDRDLLLKASNLNIQGYVLKPVAFDQMMEILNKVVLHQNQGKESIELIQLDDLILLDTINYKILANNNAVTLTKKEMQFLELLLEKKGSVVPYELIEQVIWYDNGEAMSSSSLRTLVKNVRKKLVKEDIIHNISKVGYKIL